MSINDAARLGTPLSTKLVVSLGTMLITVGGGMAIRDHLRAGPAQPAVGLPPQASGFAIPGSEHLLQYVGLLVAAVCVVGILAIARGVMQRG
jgi:hypothetical protein